MLYCQFRLQLCQAFGGFVLDMSNHLNSSSDVSDNDGYDNWQDICSLLKIVLHNNIGGWGYLGFGGSPKG